MQILIIGFFRNVDSRFMRIYLWNHRAQRRLFYHTAALVLIEMIFSSSGNLYWKDCSKNSITLLKKTFFNEDALVLS